MPTPQKILVVDDDLQLCKALQEELTEVGFMVEYAASVDDAVAYLGKQPIDLMLLDLKMPGKDGFSILRMYERNPPPFGIIVLTAYADVKSAIDAAKMGASDFVSKPYEFDELLLTIRKVLQAGS